jgi:hypothetical protein
MTRRRALLEAIGLVEIAALPSQVGDRRFHLHASPDQPS